MYRVRVPGRDLPAHIAACMQVISRPDIRLNDTILWNGPGVLPSRELVKVYHLRRLG